MCDKKISIRLRKKKNIDEVQRRRRRQKSTKQKKIIILQKNFYINSNINIHFLKYLS